MIRRRSTNRPVLFAVLSAAALSGCAALKPPTPQTPAEAEALKIIERDLQVVPIFDTSGSSGFPVSKRNVVMAAHALSGNTEQVSAGAAPMRIPQSQGWIRRKKPVQSQDDWIVIRGLQDRFKPNIIDPTVELRAGDLVFIGGFPVRPPVNNYDSVEHAQRKAEIFTARVVTPEYSNDGPCMVWLSGPTRDLHGCSGGPVAIVDKLSQVRVFGVFSRVQEFPAHHTVLLGVTRLPNKDFDKARTSPAPYPSFYHTCGMYDSD